MCSCHLAEQGQNMAVKRVRVELVKLLEAFLGLFLLCPKFVFSLIAMSKQS